MRYWNATTAERLASYPCQRYAGADDELWVRAVDVRAPADTLYRWLCQLRDHPYSYDILDNAGRRSPRRLTPGADRLVVGQRMMRIFRLVELEEGRRFTVVMGERAARVFGRVSITYAAEAAGQDASRLVVAMTVGADGPAQRARRRLLQWGDFVMMRKQLLTLKECAESIGG